jgi:monoamine oxidase
MPVRVKRRIFQTFADSEATGIPVDELLDMQRERELRKRSLAVSRRDFLKGAGAAAAIAALAAGGKPVFSMGGDPPRIAIIGAGVAGLRCAQLLKQQGIIAPILEADHRAGGRMATHPTEPPPGSSGQHHDIQFAQPVEHGGSFISSEHFAVRRLVRDLGLTLDVVNGGALFEGEELYIIDGQYYTIEQAADDWRIAWRAFKDERNAAQWPQTYDSHSQRGYELDNISVPDWFDPASPDSNPILSSDDFGPDSKFAKLCYEDVTAEYGGNASDQPALNLLYLLAWNPHFSLQPLAGTDELYTVTGGVSNVIHKLMDRLESGQIQYDRALEAIEGDNGGPPYTCHFSSGPSVVCDHLVLTLPFRILRELDIDPDIYANWGDQKKLAVETMKMGTNSKVHYQVNYRTWGPGSGKPDLNGVVYTDPDDFQLIWDDSVQHWTSHEDPAVLTQYLGGDQGANVGGFTDFGKPTNSYVNDFLARMESVFPGFSASYSGTAMVSNWKNHEWHKGAYSYWGIGGYTGYAGAEAAPEGNIHFAGEHTSVEFQGYMEGAVEGGERAASEVLSAI